MRLLASARRHHRVLALGLLSVVAGACAGACGGGGGGDNVASGWTVDTASVVGVGRTRGDSLRVDVFVDATVSMGGYVAKPTSQYADFLDNLEATIQAAWKRADVHFHRFGQAQQEIDRHTFLAAKAPAFYTEKITGIDRVVTCDQPKNVTVVLTDLFQSEGDVNAIVAGIKDRCLQRGVSVAVLGVKSAFDGTVFDARVPAYRYASTADTSTFRPFYALMFGDGANLEWLLAQLGGGRRDYVVIAPTVVRHYSATMRKAPNTTELNAQGSAGYTSTFMLRDGKQAGTMLADVVLTPSPGAPPVRAEQLELVAYRRNAPANAKAKADSSESHDVTLQKAVRSGDTLHLTLGLSLADPPGTYAYKLVLRTGGVNGFDMPAWVDRYSSTNPTPSSDANRTLNLAKFVSDLRRAASSIAQPAVATWYVTIRKK